MKFSRVFSRSRIGPHANLPRTSTTRTKITSVQSALPTFPAKGTERGFVLLRRDDGGKHGQDKNGEAENR